MLRIKYPSLDDVEEELSDVEEGGIPIIEVIDLVYLHDEMIQQNHNDPDSFAPSIIH